MNNHKFKSDLDKDYTRSFKPSRLLTLLPRVMQYKFKGRAYIDIQKLCFTALS